MRKKINTTSTAINYASIAVNVGSSVAATAYRNQAAVFRNFGQQLLQTSDDLYWDAAHTCFSGPSPLAASDAASVAAYSCAEVARGLYGKASRVLKNGSLSSGVIGSISTALSLGEKIVTGDLGIIAKGVAREAAVWGGSFLAGAALIESSPIASAAAGTFANIGLNKVFDNLGW